MSEQKKGLNPWTIIGWLLLAVIFVPIGGWIAATFVDQVGVYQAQEKARNAP